MCSEGYSERLGFSCSRCAENSAGGIAVAVFLSAAIVVLAVAVVSYGTSGKAGGDAGRGTAVERLTRYIPLQSVKIVIVAWQIITQVRAGV